MKFGIFAPPEHRPWTNWTLGFDQDLEEMSYADKLGFNEYWIGEHHNLQWETSPMPEMMIAKGSAVTERINLGTGVVTMPIHDPIKVAERLAFLDHLTHGRLLAGVGTGAPSEMAFFDVPQEGKRERMAEATEIVEKFFTSDGPVSHDGEFWQFEDKQMQFRPYQRPHPPISVAGSTSAFSYNLAVDNDYWPMSTFYALLEAKDNPEINSLVEQAAIMRQRAQEQGKNPSAILGNWRIAREVYVAETREQALEDIREGAEKTYLGFFRDQLGFVDGMKQDVDMDDSDVTLDYLIENTPWIVGTPEDCIRQIREYQEKLGELGSIMIVSRKEWVPQYKWNKSLELFAKYVMPEFQEHKGPAQSIKDGVLPNVPDGQHPG